MKYTEDIKNNSVPAGSIDGNNIIRYKKLLYVELSCSYCSNKCLQAKNNYRIKNKPFCNNKCHCLYRTGKTFSQETKDKISKAVSGKKRTIEQRKNISEGHKGQIPWCTGLTKETDARIKDIGEKVSKSRKGMVFTKEHRENIRKASLNISDETRKKMSMAGIGKKRSPEACRNISEGQKGRKFSKEHCENISKALKGKPLTKERKKNMRLAAIKRIQNSEGQINPNHNKKACIFFEKINKQFGLQGMHAENGGEMHLKHLGYWLDYYDPYLNIVISWNENAHYRCGEFKKKYVQRQREIKKYLGCIFFNIREGKENLFDMNQIAIIKKERNKKVA